MHKHLKPLVVIVTASWHTPQFYSHLTAHLLAAGFDVRCPHLPSCGGPSSHDPTHFGQLSLLGDALAIRLELIRLVEYDERDVIVMMHSYGGLVGTEAVAEDLSSAARGEQGMRGGVAHLVYLAGYWLPVGESVMSKFGDSKNSVVHSDNSFTIEDPLHNLYNDMPEDAVPSKQYWASQLVRQPMNVQHFRMTRAAYEYVSATYLVCERDHTVPPHAQEAFAVAMGAELRRCHAGHSAMLTQPQRVTDVIHHIAKEASLL